MTLHAVSTNENPSKRCGNDAGQREVVVQNNEKIARGDDDDDDDDDEMMDIRVPSGMMLLDDSDGGGGIAGDGGIAGAGGNAVVERSQPTETVPQKPAENLRVDDRAILDCWNLTVASHEAVAVASDSSNTATTALSSASSSSPTSSSPSPVSSDTLLDTKYRWNAVDEAPAAIAGVGEGGGASGSASALDPLKGWQPKPLALPVWAVDPFETEEVASNGK